MHDERPLEAPAEQPMIDLTVQTDAPGDVGAHDQELGCDSSNELIDLTEDSTTTSPDQKSSRNPGEGQQVPALQRALNQASNDLANFRDSNRRILDEQEAALSCPISYELFENPVVTACCGKTFSSEALTEVLRWNPRCPVCRTPGVRTHASRDMSNLVELYRKQRSLLTQAEAEVKQSTESAELASDRQSSSSTSSRRRGREERRNQRVHARSAVARPQSTNAAATGIPAPARADWQDEDSDDDWQDEYLWWLQT